MAETEVETIEELIAMLHSEDGMEQQHAAEELGARGDPAAVDALAEALSGLTFEDEAHYFVAPSLIEALAKLGDPRAAEALVAACEASCGHDVVPFVACDALVRLRAVRAVPSLRRLIGDETFSDHAPELAKALVALGGPAEGPLFHSLLGRDQEQVQVSAAEALGALRYLPAAASLAERLDDASDDVRLAVIGALIDMDAPGATDRLRNEMSRATSWFEKSTLLRVIRQRRIQEMAGILLEKLEDPVWNDSDSVLLETLETAARIGSPAAKARMRVMVSDAASSPCARARCATILLDQGEDDLLPWCMEYLRRNGGHADDDPRDVFVIRNEIQEGIVATLAHFAKSHRHARLPVLDLLDAVRREKHGNPGPVARRASSAISELTGTERYSEYDTWRKAQGS